MQHTILTEHILSAFNLDSLPEEQRVVLLEQMTEVAEQRILLRILSGLSDEQKQTFESLMDNGDQSAVQLFFEQHVPDVLGIIEEETTRLKQDLLQRIGKV
jgi:Mg/Co/Ni transporter MgtE